MLVVADDFTRECLCLLADTSRSGVHVVRELDVLIGRLGYHSRGVRALDSAVRHLAIVERFGRFPHRNAILGRTSTPEEIAFLTRPDSTFLRTPK